MQRGRGEKRREERKKCVSFLLFLGKKRWYFFPSSTFALVSRWRKWNDEENDGEKNVCFSAFLVCHVPISGCPSFLLPWEEEKWNFDEETTFFWSFCPSHDFHCTTVESPILVVTFVFWFVFLDLCPLLSSVASWHVLLDHFGSLYCFLATLLFFLSFLKGKARQTIKQRKKNVLVYLSCTTFHLLLSCYYMGSQPTLVSLEPHPTATQLVVISDGGQKFGRSSLLQGFSFFSLL